MPEIPPVKWGNKTNMKIEMHVHTKYELDCSLEPEQVIAVARKRGIDAVCFTGHNLFMEEALERIGIKEGFPVFVGMEYHSSDGHVLLYGAGNDQRLQERHLPMQAVIDLASECGGIAIPAHPYINQYRCCLGDKIYTLKGLFAVESINRRLDKTLNALAEKARIAMGLKGIGGSDTHFLSNLGKVFTEFNCEIKDIAGLINALKYGDYHPVDLRH